MTWNLQDALRSTATKTESDNNGWAACAHIIAALQPDILILQETGDNSCCGGSNDGVSTLNLLLDYFFFGGNDVFNGNTPITSYVQLYAPSYDLPHRFISSDTDGFNRNIILSRFPFADLNGDFKATMSDIPSVQVNSAYAPGGDGGVRGFMFAEVDLPDTTYVGDLVVGNAHLKCCGSASDQAQRRDAAQNTAYVIDYWFNGAGTGSPDPNSRISDSPQATSILDADTPVIVGGDLNEDEQTNGQDGPANWLSNADPLVGADGTDRDGSNATQDNARHPFNPSWRCTQGSCSSVFGSKLDYLIWQDSIATARHEFLFDSEDTPAGSYPAEILSYANTTEISDDASDHRPVIVDFILPIVPISGGACCTNDACADGVEAIDCANGGGHYQGDATTCSGVDCTVDTGACCDGLTCFDGVIQSNCEFGGLGVYQGDASVCAGVDCDATGACCTGETCTDDESAGSCITGGGTYEGNGSSCSGVTCMAGCVENGACDDADVCTYDTCNTGMCFNDDIAYGDLDGDDDVDLNDIVCSADGFAGAFAGDCTASSVDIAPCTPDGTINIDDVLATLDAFAGTDPCCGGSGGVGACCDDMMNCFDGVSQENCEPFGGTFQGDGTTCATDPCGG